MVRHALVHHDRGAVGQRAVDDVAVAGHPADVGGAPEDVGLGVEVEHVLVGVGDLGQVAAGRVHDALRLAGRARRVEQEQQLLAVHRLGRAARRRRRRRGRGTSGRGPSTISTSLPPRRTTTTCSIVGRRRQRLVGGRLEREHLAPAVAAVGGDQHLGLGVVDAVGQRLRREAAEHDAVGGADAGAGEHRDDRLGDHRQVDVDPVARWTTPSPLRRVGEALHLGQQLGVGDRAARRRARPRTGSPPCRRGRPRRGGRGSCATALSWPPTNHLASGSCHSQIVSHSGRPVEQLGRLAGPEALVVAGRLVVQRRVDDEGVALERRSDGGNVRCSASSASIVSAACRESSAVGHVRTPMSVVGRRPRAGLRRMVGARDGPILPAGSQPVAALEVAVQQEAGERHRRRARPDSRRSSRARACARSSCRRSRRSSSARRGSPPRPRSCACPRSGACRPGPRWR